MKGAEIIFEDGIEKFGDDQVMQYSPNILCNCRCKQSMIGINTSCPVENPAWSSNMVNLSYLSSMKVEKTRSELSQVTWFDQFSFSKPNSYKITRHDVTMG